MDPITQGLLGAVTAQALLGRRLGARAALMGGMAGVLPDADVLIGTPSDPLLAIEYHRQFTHALAFIPAGGLIAALPWFARKRSRLDWRPILAATTAGCATHGLLDACTTCGTQLFWPFSTQRVAFNWISIIDSLFTLVLLTGVVLAVRRRTRRPAAIALALCLGLSGHRRLAGRARSRGASSNRARTRTRHRSRRSFPDDRQPDRMAFALPVGQNVLCGPNTRAVVGTSAMAGRQRDPGTERGGLAAALADPRVRRDLARFSWFSNGWVARSPRDSRVIGDMRYSLRTGAFHPPWGVRLHPGAEVPTQWVEASSDRESALAELWTEIVNAKP